MGQGAVALACGQALDQREVLALGRAQLQFGRVHGGGQGIQQRGRIRHAGDDLEERPIALASADDVDARVMGDELRPERRRVRSAATVERAGHMLRHDQPERVAALIEGFVDA